MFRPRAKDLSSVAPSNDRNGCIRPRPNRDCSPASWRPISLWWGTIDPSEKPSGNASWGFGLTQELTLKRARHPDAIFMHRELFVDAVVRKRSIRQQVVLVSGMNDSPSERRKVDVLPIMDSVDHVARFGLGMRAHRRLGVEITYAKRNNAQGCQFRVRIEHGRKRFIESGTIVSTGTHDDLTVDLNPVIKQCAKPTKTRSAPPVPEH